MKKQIMLILTLPMPVLAEMPKDFAEKMADAIYVAEGSDQAKAPYGILSVPIKDKADARRICLNSITNNWKRWEKSGKTNCFVDFMANRWVPIKSDPKGNKNWKKNVKAIMKKQSK